MGWCRRWTAFSCVCALVSSLGCATVPARGWDALCARRVTRVTPLTERHLREANIRPGLHGWQPSPVWIQDQCEALGYGD